MARAILRFLTPYAGSLGVGLAVIIALAWALVAIYGAGERAGRAAVQATIDRPVTGWSARLATCGANVASLGAGLKRQNDALAAQSAADEKRLRQAADAVSAAAQATKDSARRVAALQAPLKGTDTCARLLEVDGRVKEMFK